MEENHCRKCDEILEAENLYCIHCGHSSQDSEEKARPDGENEGKTVTNGRRWLPRVAIFLLFLLVVGGGIYAWRHYAKSDLAALVGDEKIYWSEIDQKLQSLKGMFTRDMNVDIDSPQAGQLVADLKNQILDALIQEKVLLAEAGKAGAKVSPEEVTARVAEIQKERALSDEAFAELLKGHGLTRETLQDRVHRELLIEQAIAAGVKETGLDREEWLEKVFSMARVEVFPIK